MRIAPLFALLACGCAAIASQALEPVTSAAVRAIEGIEDRAETVIDARSRELVRIGEQAVEGVGRAVDARLAATGDHLVATGEETGGVSGELLALLGTLLGGTAAGATAWRAAKKNGMRTGYALAQADPNEPGVRETMAKCGIDCKE